MIQRLAEERRLSGAVVHAGTVYLAGQVADDPSLDAEGQTRDILRQVDHLLDAAGTSKEFLLSVQIFLADMADFDGMNRAWGRVARSAAQARPGHGAGPACGPALAGRDHRDRRPAAHPSASRPGQREPLCLTGAP